MEITVDIRYEQLLDLVRRLPAGKIKQLKADLDDRFIEVKAEKEVSDFQNFLLDGPVMSADQYIHFSENRKHLNKWREK